MTYSFRKPIITRKIHFSLESPEHSHITVLVSLVVDENSCPIVHYFPCMWQITTKIDYLHPLVFLLLDKMCLNLSFFMISTPSLWFALNHVLSSYFRMANFCQWAIVMYLGCVALTKECYIAIFIFQYYSVNLQKFVVILSWHNYAPFNSSRI